MTSNIYILSRIVYIKNKRNLLNYQKYTSQAKLIGKSLKKEITNKGEKSEKKKNAKACILKLLHVFTTMRHHTGEFIYSFLTTAFLRLLNPSATLHKPPLKTKPSTLITIYSHTHTHTQRQHQREMADKKLRFCGLCLIFLVLSVNNASFGRGQEDALAPGASETSRELVPAMFIFGDSLIDNGNNNDLPSFAKANYFPYGIDFNGGPTGRFSNGYTMVDTIGTFRKKSSQNRILDILINCFPFFCCLLVSICRCMN